MSLSIVKFPLIIIMLFCSKYNRTRLIIIS
nr:MAG TPA: High affinity nerve growth factor receptor, TRANSFERASE [Crassvirales sp.]